MSVLGSLKTINRKLGNPLRVLRGARESIEPRMRLRKFEKDRRVREQKYAGANFTFQARPDVVSAIEKDGYTILRGAFEVDILKTIYDRVEQLLDRGESLQKISNDSVRTPGDLSPPKVHFSPEEVKRGQDYFRKHTNYVSIANPLVAVPEVADVAFHPLLLDIAQSYLGCPPALGGLNLRKSYKNDLPAFDTLYFHVDPNSPRFLKVFFYLNDVDEGGGPFCYVKGSRDKRFSGWMSKGRWTWEEMEQKYGKENVKLLTAKVGDIVVADTNGFHAGVKITSRDRTMLTLDYVVHEEFEGTQSSSMFQLPRAVFDRLPPRAKAAADFLQVLP